jgi:hypothetical protein
MPERRALMRSPTHQRASYGLADHLPTTCLAFLPPVAKPAPFGRQRPTPRLAKDHSTVGAGAPAGVGCAIEEPSEGGGAAAPADFTVT